MAETSISEEVLQRVAELDRRVTEITSLLGVNVDEVTRQLQTLQGGSGALEPLSLIGAWDETPPFVTALAGNPVVTYVGEGQVLLAGRSIVFERLANSPYLRISASSGLMNVDYVVANDGSGTHLTLFGTTGALTQAVTDQADRVIWVCTTHTETVTESVDLSGLANEQQIKIMSGGPYRPTITANPTVATDALFTQPFANSGTGWRYIFEGINFAAAVTKTPSVFRPNAGVGAAAIEFVSCNFEGAGAWQYGLDLGGAGSATSAGMIWDNCRGTLRAMARLSGGGAATGPFIVRDCMLTLTYFTERTIAPPTDAEFEAGTSYIITDNTITLNSGAVQGMTLAYANAVPMLVSNNYILYTGTNRCFQFGNNSTTSVYDITVTGNHIYCNTAGSSAIAFDNDATFLPTPTMRDVVVQGNTLRGPGSGTAIIRGGSAFTITGCSFQPNGFRDWAVNVASDLPQAPLGGAPDTATFVTLSTDATLTNERVLTPQSAYTPVGGVGFIDGGAGTTVTATLKDLTATWAQAGAFNIWHTGALRVGSATAPTNVTPGDGTFARIMVGDDGALGSDRRFQVRYGTAVAPAAGGLIGASINLISAPAAATGPAIGLLVDHLVRPTANSAAIHQALKFSMSHDSGAFDLTGTAFAGVQGETIQNVAGTTISDAAGVRGFLRAQAGTITTGRTFDARLGLTGDAGAFGTLVGYDVADIDVPTGGIVSAIGFRTRNLGAAGVTDAIGLDIAAQSGASGLNIGVRNLGTLLQSGTSLFGAAVDIDAQVNLSAELVLDPSSTISTISKSRQSAGDQFVDVDFDGLSASEDARIRIFRSTVAAGADDRFTIFSPNTSTVSFEVFANSGNTFVRGALEIDGAINHDGTTVGFYGQTPAARAAAYTPTNVTTDRSYDANATTTDELADVLGTLIADLQTYGLLQ